MNINTISTYCLISLGESIGSGYFGNVYKAKMEQGDKNDEDDAFEIAVKTLQKEAKQQEKIKFLQEAALMAQFHHTNVLKIIGVVAENNTVSCIYTYQFYYASI